MQNNNHSLCEGIDGRLSPTTTAVDNKRKSRLQRKRKEKCVRAHHRKRWMDMRGRCDNGFTEKRLPCAIIDAQKRFNTESDDASGRRQVEARSKAAHYTAKAQSERRQGAGAREAHHCLCNHRSATASLLLCP